MEISFLRLVQQRAILFCHYTTEANEQGVERSGRATVERSSSVYSSSGRRASSSARKSWVIPDQFEAVMGALFRPFLCHTKKNPVERSTAARRVYARLALDSRSTRALDHLLVDLSGMCSCLQHVSDSSFKGPVIIHGRLGIGFKWLRLFTRKFFCGPLIVGWYQ